MTAARPVHDYQPDDTVHPTSIDHVAGGDGHPGAFRSPEALRLVPWLPGTTASGDAPPLRRILTIVDVATILSVWLLAVALADRLVGHNTSFDRLALASAAVTASGWALASLMGLYLRRVAIVRSLELSRLAWTAAGLAVVAGLVRLPAGGEAALATALIAGIGWFVALMAERGIVRAWITSRRASGDFRAPVVVVAGDRKGAAETATFLTANPILGFEVRAVLAAAEMRSNRRNAGDRTLGKKPQLAVDMVRSVGATGVVIDNRGLTGDELNQFVQDAGTGGLHSHLSSGLRGVAERRVTLSPLADETFLHVAPHAVRPSQLVTKRVIDLVLGTLALVALSPVLAFAALGTWLGDRGPVLFRQERVGLDGAPFTLYKLRTMVVDAEARRADLEAENQRDGPLFKLAGDPRITPVGRILRATSVDEIPQLFNVLSGSMSLVGPRPALASETESFDAELRRRVSVKPGITGLWQVEARDAPSFELYRRYDLLYVKNWSSGLDLFITARTVAVVGLRGLRALSQIGRRGSGHVLD